MPIAVEAYCVGSKLSFVSGPIQCQRNLLHESSSHKVIGIDDCLSVAAVRTGSARSIHNHINVLVVGSGGTRLLAANRTQFIIRGNGRSFFTLHRDKVVETVENPQVLASETVLSRINSIVFRRDMGSDVNVLRGNSESRSRKHQK